MFLNERCIMHFLWIAVTIYFNFVRVNCVRIEKNGYKAIAIAFSEQTQQNSIDFEKLKSVLSNASELLYHATRRRSYLEEFILVLPSAWTNNGACEEYVTEAPEKVDIYFTESPEVSEIRTQHSKGCGQEGDIIYVPSKWLHGEVYDLAAQFVQQWSIFRYGVFQEKPEKPGTCLSNSDDTWSPAGCYNTELDVVPQFGENGLPVCYFPKNFTDRSDLVSSIMFTANSSTVLNYCDGSPSFPHNTIAPSLHNRICEGQTVWSVIKNTEDFIYGRNLPLKDAKPPSSTAFRCFRESKPHVTLTVQNSSVDVLSETITEIRYALLHFLTNMVTSDSSVNLLTFSESASSQSVALKLEDKKDLSVILDSQLKQNNPVSSVCFSCGLEKAYEEASDNHHSSQVVVLLSWESSYDNKKTSNVIELIQSHPKTLLYLLFIDDDDTVNDIVPSSLVEAVQGVGGRIFRLTNDPVFMVTQLNIALLDAFRNVLGTEDQSVVVHEKVYDNVTSDFTDTFLTPRVVRGRVLYTMHCRTRGIIRNVNGTCNDWDTDSLTYKCGNEFFTNYYKPPVTVWRHHFERFDNFRPIVCSSLAMMRFEKPSTSPFTVRGWLNYNKITPGRNALIIYAEVFGTEYQDVHVEARISGPGLESFRLDLRDNGNGDPDIVKGDGIFSRYFTSFTQKGTYVVSVHAMCRVPERDITYADDIPEYDERKLTQMKIIGTFSVSQRPAEEDILPPNRITDLTVVSINHQNRTILLQWTAPGDDYDYGKAYQYIFKLSHSWMTLLDFTFNEKENILLIQPGFFPAESGVLQSLEFQFLQSNKNATYYIGALATDEIGNKAKVSNIVQIHFTDVEVTVIDNLTTSSENTNYNQTSTSHSTDINSNTEVTNNATDFETTESIMEDNINITGSKVKDGIFIERKTAIIAFSTVGAIILLLIIINIIVCCCCFMKKKKSNKPKKLSRKASLRPPYNLNIAYRRGSESSLDGETRVGNSLRTSVDQSSNYSNLQGGIQSEQRYAYHTNKSLMNKEGNQGRKNELGFKVVQAMPAYASSSLSRFVSRDTELDKGFEPEDKGLNIAHKSTNRGDAHMYPLGTV